MMTVGEDQQFSIEELRELYDPVKEQIEGRLDEFRQIWEKAGDEELFQELIFCLLTPQSKAKTCWKAVQRLKGKCLIAKGEPCQIREELFGVRFNKRKSDYICNGRIAFSSSSLRTILQGFNSPFEAREWLVENVLGLGYKEASHFLRNIGIGENLAILDRHILKNLVLLGVIDEVPSSLSRKIYLDIECKMIEFSNRVGISMGQLDLLLWYKEAGEGFK